MLIYHCRNYYNLYLQPVIELVDRLNKGSPYATIVAIPTTNKNNAIDTGNYLDLSNSPGMKCRYRIGVSICHPKDYFNKRMGVKIAVERALKDKKTSPILPSTIPSGTVVNRFGEIVSLKDDLFIYINKMEQRAKAYYK